MTGQTLDARLTRLERQNRRLRHGLVAVGLAVGAVLWMAQASILPSEVRAQRILLVDDRGEIRIELRADHGVPSVALRDADGVLVELTGWEGRGVIRYRDADESMRDLAAPMRLRPATRK